MRRMLAVIPARAGSKGIKDKNVVLIDDKPLIWYTIIHGLEALKGRLVDKVVLSTDSTKIAEIANKFGVEVPFIRPSKLGRDNTKSADVVLHTVNFLAARNDRFDAVLLLQPTSPLRSCEDIKRSIQLFYRKRVSSLISVYKEDHILASTLYAGSKDNTGLPIARNHNDGTRRQSSLSLFVRNGAIYITAIPYLIKYRKLISGKPAIYEMPRERSLNIDTPENLRELVKMCGKKSKQ